MQNGGVYVNGPQAASTAPAAGTILGGDNGLSRSTVDPTLLVLGNDVGSTDAALISDRVIPLNGFSIEMRAPGLGNDRLRFQASEMSVTNGVARLALAANSLIWFDLVGGNSTDLIYSVAAGVHSLQLQLSGTNSGFLIDVTNGRICIGNNVVTPTAILHLLAGVAGVSGAPFKYTAGAAAQTALENGAKNFNGTNEFITAGGVNYTMAKTLTATAALNFPNTAAQTSADLTIALTGAALGDVVLLGVPNASADANTCYTAFVSAANTVTVRFNNYSAGAVDPASATFRVAIVKY